MAIKGPRVLSRQQQQLVCLRASHVDCPRYRLATTGASTRGRGPLRVPNMPRATAAALVVLAISAVISFGFVLQRGGIDLPSAASSPGGLVAAASAAVASAGASSRTPAATSGASSGPSDVPSSAASASAPSIAPTATPIPRATRTPTPRATATPAAPGGVPSADRLAVISPCPDQAGCWIYDVRAGDNLWSIAHWFGVPLDTVYAWNPTVKQTGIHPGIPLRIPTPTR